MVKFYRFFNIVSAPFIFIGLVIVGIVAFQIASLFATAKWINQCFVSVKNHVK